MKKRKKSGIGALKDLPYQEIVGGVIGATVSKKVVPMLTDKMEVAFLNENPWIVKAAKAALGVGLTMVNNRWVQGIGIGMAAEAAADFIGEKMDAAMAGIGTAMDNAPTPVTQMPNAFIAAPFTEPNAFISQFKQQQPMPVQQEISVDYIM